MTDNNWEILWMCLCTLATFTVVYFGTRTNKSKFDSYKVGTKYYEAGGVLGTPLPLPPPPSKRNQFYDAFGCPVRFKDYGGIWHEGVTCDPLYDEKYILIRCYKNVIYRIPRSEADDRIQLNE